MRGVTRISWGCTEKCLLTFPRFYKFHMRDRGCHLDFGGTYPAPVVTQLRSKRPGREGTPTLKSGEPMVDLSTPAPTFRRQFCLPELLHRFKFGWAPHFENPSCALQTVPRETIILAALPSNDFEELVSSTPRTTLQNDQGL